MWKLNCGCNPPEENNYIISDIINKKSINNRNFNLPNKEDKTKDLKCELIYDFLNVIDNLECGIQSDLQEILEELSLIEFDNTGKLNLTKRIIYPQIDESSIYYKDYTLSGYWSDNFYWNDNQYWSDLTNE